MNMADIQKTKNPITENIRALMLKKGVPKKEHSREVARILGLSVSQAYKKFSGMADWSMAQIRCIEKEYGQRIGEQSDSPDDLRSQTVDVTLYMGSEEVPAFAVIGPLALSRQPKEFVAVGGAGNWKVMRAEAVPPAEAFYSIKFLEIELPEARHFSVAILDDDRAMADTIAEFLNASGTYEATAFYSLDSLDKALEDEQYDAYILDWKIGSKTSESLIQKIRVGANSDATVYLLTGQVDTDREDDIVRIQRAYKAHYLEKPVRMKMLAVQIAMDLEAPKAG
ncbi:helix-turn-helix domain-containing protein [Noviherbaspirillum pedocola]|uniref:Response regulator n=1 Tax=Noviherbaspirillum pedocola TaxID=2801341 RepID=A0A934SSM0_9BURK|nr:helix-turn-helix domain-containing protein [Noviherbaspirillum pedocola]MBK4736021.1 response regulator [Noviherbaspirillum pedocola]